MLFNTSKYKQINPKCFTADDFELEDIAQGLSRLCRFSGQCNKFYSVAEHSYHLSYIVNPSYALEALLHDASEAYISDISRPWKELLKDYVALEKIIQSAINTKFNVTKSYHVEMRDTNVGNYEAAVFFGLTENLIMLEVPMKFWKPKKAYKKFMERYNELMRASSGLDFYLGVK